MTFTKRVFLVICLPLAFELVLSCALIVFTCTTHDQLSRITSSEAVIKHCTDVLGVLTEKATLIVSASATGADLVARPEHLDLNESQKDSLRQLEQAVASDSELSTIGPKLHNEAQALIDLFVHYANLLRRQPSRNSADKQARWKTLDSAENELIPLSRTLVQTLSEITTIESSRRDVQLESESQYRATFNFILLVTALVGIAASALVALWCVKELRWRMEVLMINASKMANREDLLPSLPGNNELSQLDAVFHSVDQAIEDSLARERAVFEYAADLVCSIDRSGIFQYANPSAARLLGYSPRELSGRSFLDVVAPADCARADHEFDAASKTHEPRSFELRLLRADRREIDSDWSVLWSAVDGSLFCVVSDITERKNVERLKEDFVSMIRQDIRSPLAAIDEAIESVLAGHTGEVSADAGAELATCKRTADRLIQMISDLLRFESTHSKTMDFKLAPTFIAPIVQGALGEVQTLANNAGVKLRFSEKPCRAIADESRLMQLLINLLSNAIRYSPQGGTVSVLLRETKGVLEIAICDQGPGVPDDLKEKIFLPFEQAPGSKVTSSGGTGLGLAIAKLIVDGHHGTIGIRDGKSGGSIFWFTLPTSVASVP